MGDERCQNPDPVCKNAQQGIAQIYTAERYKLLPGLQQAADGANSIAAGNAGLAVGLAQLHDGLLQARSGIVQLQDGGRVLQEKLGQLSGGASPPNGCVIPACPPAST